MALPNVYQGNLRFRGAAAALRQRKLRFRVGYRRAATPLESIQLDTFGILSGDEIPQLEGKAFRSEHFIFVEEARFERANYIEI